MSASTKTPPPPRSEPGSHNPRFESHDPVTGWLRENRGFLVLLILAVVGGGLLQYYLPKLRTEGRAESWDLYGTATQSFFGELTPETLQSSLDQARDDDRVFPWVVLRASQAALASGDPEVLAILRPELSALEESGSLAGIMVATPEGPQEIVPYVRERVSQPATATADLDFSLPEPDGASIKLILTNAETDTYEIVVGLYANAAPETTARFLEAAEEGRLTQAAGSRGVGSTLRFTGLRPEGVDPEEDELPLEVAWGYFHAAGVLTTARKPGAGSGQDGDAFEILLDEAFHLDGSSTVFGKILEGAEALEELRTTPNSEDPVRDLKISTAEVLP